MSLCSKCHKPTPMHLLDAKPRMTPWLFLVWLVNGESRMLRYAADHGYDFTELECAACYGLEWSSADHD